MVIAERILCAIQKLDRLLLYRPSMYGATATGAAP
jgi:hypothetical protein